VLVEQCYFSSCCKFQEDLQLDQIILCMNLRSLQIDCSRDLCSMCEGLINWDCLKVHNLVPPKNTSAAEHDSKLIIKSHKREHVQVRIRYINIIISSFTLLRNFKRCNLIIQNFETKFKWCRKIKTTFKKFCKTFK
jgi:hypothetical protein